MRTIFEDLGEPCLSRAILLAEDNPIDRSLALLHLEQLGYAVEAVPDGRAALEAVRAAAEPYALILMDCQMPEMDGFQATRAIRALEETRGRRTPILAVTARAMPSDRAACLAAGMDDYVSKPVRWEKLRSLLERWLPPREPVGKESSAPTQGERNRAPAPPQAVGRERVPGWTLRSTGPLDAQIVAGLHDLRRESSAGEFDAVLANFLSSARLRIENMVEAASQGDAAQLEWIAHSLKGSSGSFGACRMAAICHEVEQFGRAGALESAALCLNQLAEEYKHVAAALGAEFDLPEDPLPLLETSD